MQSIWKIQDLLTATEGKLINEGTLPLTAVSTDTREDLKNKIFFALRGENFDGNDFAQKAVDSGAGAIVIDRDIQILPNKATVIKVKDTLKALQKFSSHHRSRWHGKMVALTGSNGKTTTKEFIATILAQKYPTLATIGSLNNHIGVPLTLLQLRAEHKFAVVEMGMNHAGEIADLVSLAQPDVVLVTNVGSAHIEHFPEGLGGIAKAKEEIYEHAPARATRIYNMDDELTAMMRARAPGGCKIMTYSSHTRDVDVSLKEKLFTLDYIDVHGVIGGEPGSARIPVFGRQQIANAMAASTVALAMGIDAPMIWKALSKFHGSWGRGQMVELQNGAHVIFDAYNANPDSSKTALQNFAKMQTKGNKYVVFGDMLEMGKESPRLHFELGLEIAKLDPTAALLFGSQATDVERGMREGGFLKNIVVSNTYQEKLAVDFADMLEPQDIVLVKGSRGMKLERVVQAWQPKNFANEKEKNKN